MRLWFQCEQCDNRVGIQLDVDNASGDVKIDVRCATRHPRPVRMTRVETPPNPLKDKD